ncbi:MULTISPECIES: fimbria/pilus outer membrane usher protein [unclassified Polaromonas]|uniref:fimbria/pilus outer membrane usher protein n=1 Tax=unclassified Polaromonas TaxID=2638319 RepID=UPI0013DE3A87|nr:MULTISPECIES: fimbria/pilus outer membrane usher protein [unclassified Polaromonas]
MPEEDFELYLDVTLNTVKTDHLSRFVKKAGTPAPGLHASAQTLKQIGLNLPAGLSFPAEDGLIALASVPGLTAEFNVATQRLALVAPVELLNASVVRFGAQFDPLASQQVRVDPSTQVPGLVANYDLFAQNSGGQKTVSAFTEARLFGVGPGVYSNTMVSRADSGADSGAGSTARYRNIRLDTSWQRNFPDEAVSLTVGDLTTGSLPWSRAARIGGVRLSSNFALQPYRATTPLASFQGSALLPSTVDLFINGLKQTSQTVQPGQFQLSGVPSLGGAGQAQMVITDINGQSRTVSFDLYGAPQLLEAGLTSWSLDLGTVRRNYGLESFSYSGLLASASGRYGLSASTTLEAHAEAGSGVVQGGMGGVWLLPGQTGLLSASLAGSHQSASAAAMNTPANGRQHAGGYQWNTQRFTVSLNSLRRSPGFRDVASLAIPATQLPARGSDSAYFGVGMGDWGQVGFSLIRQVYFNAPPERYASIGWSYSLPGNAYLNLSINRNLDDASGARFYLSWSMPLERNLYVSSSVQHSQGRDSLALNAVRTPPGDVGGWGWRVQAGLGDGQSLRGQVSRLGPVGQWTAGVDQQGGQANGSSNRTVYGSANGGLVLMRGGLHASRRVDDAFALVSTSGVPGVPVRLENRLIGETDANGELFVTQLNAYQKNKLAIDTLNLPADMRIARESMDAVPESRSGMLANFELRRILALQFSLRDTAGKWIAAGSQVRFDVAPSPVPLLATAPVARPGAVVGHDGLVYLEDPPPGAALRVFVRGGECGVALPAGIPGTGSVDLGVLTCQ